MTRVFRAAAAAVLGLAASSAFAEITYTIPEANYSASFDVVQGGFQVLRTGNSNFDTAPSYPGAWKVDNEYGQSFDYGRHEAHTSTRDIASYSIAPDGTFVPTLGGAGYGHNRDYGGLGPVAIGTAYGFACGSPVTGCATGSHTESYAQTGWNNLSARAKLTDLYAEVDTYAEWSRGFVLDAGASFTFSGFATASITGDEAPLQFGSNISTNSDSWMTLSSLSYGDLLGRARTVLGASIWGSNSSLGDISYLVGADGLLSLTVTNNSDSALWGRINAGSYVDVSAPIPEPETWLMLLAGAGLVGGVARRRAQRAA